MEVKLGYTSITCRHCGTVTAVQNEALETMREHRCPACDARMTDYELASMKLMYYLLMTAAYDRHWGSVKQYEQFDYHIHISPHFEVRENNQNQETKDE